MGRGLDALPAIALPAVFLRTFSLAFVLFAATAPLVLVSRLETRRFQRALLVGGAALGLTASAAPVPAALPLLALVVGAVADDDISLVDEGRLFLGYGSLVLSVVLVLRFSIGGRSVLQRLWGALRDALRER